MKNVRNMLGVDKLHNKGILGTDVGVAILDTGIYMHNDFVLPKSRVVAFKDFVNNRNSPYDDNGHGTHVAGICASNGYASKGLYRGIAPRCNIIAEKVLDNYGIGSVDAVEKALHWTLKYKDRFNIKVVNLSIGTYGGNIKDIEKLIQCVEMAWDDGLVVLTAAGNKGPMLGSVTDPGTSRKIITVGSSEECISYKKNGKIIRDFSGCGPTKECIVKPEVVAPGCNIVSCANKYNMYINKSGTSMSTPIVSGAVALALSLINEKDNDKNMGVNKYIKKKLFETSYDMGKDKNKQGWGLINIEGLVKCY